MAGEAKQTDFKQGPYLAAAFLCERVLVEQDGVLSAIRVVDRVTRTVEGSHLLNIALVSPPGDTRSLLQQTILFDGQEDRGVNVISRMAMRLEVEGLY